MRRILYTVVRKALHILRLPTACLDGIQGHVMTGCMGDAWDPPEI